MFLTAVNTCIGVW